MPLARGTINPLNVLKLRALKFIPKHFTKITISRSINIKLLDQWISYHLNSRYAIKKSYTLDHNNKLIEVYEVGLEDPKEVTLLTLGCPLLHNIREEKF